MTLTQLHGAFIVSVGGVDVSWHATEREAIVAAIARTGSVQYRHDYLVQVGSAVALVALKGQSLGAIVGNLGPGPWWVVKSAALKGQLIGTN